MAIDPGNSSMNTDYGRSDGFKLGQGKDFGKSSANIGMSSGFGDKSGIGKRGLDSLYAQAHQRRELKLQENSTAKTGRDAIVDKPQKTENGALEYAQSITVNSAVRKIIKTMDEKKAFDPFLSKEEQRTLRNKIKVAKTLINGIEGKDVSWNSYLHKTKANSTAREILNKGVKGIDGLKVRENYTSMQAKKAVAGTIGELTRNKEIQRRANRT